MENAKNFIARFAPYVEDIRRRLFSTAIVFMLSFGVGFFSAVKILRFILSFFDVEGVVIATTSPFQFADLSLDIGLSVGLLVTCPVILFHAIRFLRPALTGKERGMMLAFIPLVGILFVAGSAYGFAVMYYALVILAGINASLGIQNIWDIGMFLSQILLTSALLGVLFQFPVICSFAIRMGLADVEYMRSKRRFAIVAIAAFVALLPPTDGVSLIAMALPLVLLYEVTILANSRYQKRKEAAEHAPIGFAKALAAILIVASCYGAGAHAANAEYERYGRGDSATIGEFVYDDDFVATTTAACTVTIYNPSGTQIVNAASMTADLNGWTHYTYSVPAAGPDGVWPTQMACGSSLRGDLVKVDKSFVVGNTLLSTSTIAASVWSSPTRTLTSAALTSGTLATRDDIVTASSSLYSTLPSAIWASPTRSLTSFGSLVADIWANGTRTLTSASLSALDVWTYATRSLTDATLTSGSLATAANVTTASSSIGSAIAIASSSIAAVVNSNTNAQTSGITTAVNSNTNSAILTASSSLGSAIAAGTALVNSNTNAAVLNASSSVGSLIAGSISTINANTAATVLTASSSLAATIPLNVWSSASRTLTAFGTLAADVWNVATSTFTAPGTAGKQLLLAGTSAGAGSSLTASDVWSFGTRTLTGAGLTSGSLAVQSDVITASSSIGSAITAGTASVNSNTNSAILTASSSIAAVVNNNTNAQTSGITTAVNANTNAAVLTASSSIGSAVSGIASAVNSSTSAQLASAVSAVNSNTNATVLAASSSLATSIPAAVWNYTTRTISSFGSVVADTATAVWGSATRTLTGAGLTSGSLATQLDVTTASSSIAAVVNSNTNTQTSGIASSVNSNTNAAILAASSSIGNTINSNTNAQVASAISTINTNTNATVLTASTSLASTIPLNVWASSARTLTAFGTLAADVWSVATSTFTAPGTAGKQLVLNSSVTSGGGSGITASDVWSFGSRSLTDATLTSGSLATAANVTTASSSLGSAISGVSAGVNANTNAAVLAASSSIGSQLTGAVATVNTNTNAAVLTASSSIGSMLASLPTTIWNYISRTLTSFTPATQLWSVTASDFGAVTAGSNYLATVYTIYEGTLTDSQNVPTVTMYDPSRNVVVNGAAMTRVSAGTYTYSYATPSNAAAGTWESVFSATVATGKTLAGNDYWTVVTSPAQVIINSISDDTVPQVAANITITNEGLSGNEYQYEWCVVSTVNNACGGGDDVFHAIAAKYINPGEDFNTTLTADVAAAGAYYFKVVAYFGTDSSVASRSFTAISDGSTGGGNTGGGGGGGGGSAAPAAPADTGSCRRADFNCDGKVNSIDFSILLYFWKSKPPFSNVRVDINKDSKVDSVDFSILLYQWDKK